MSQLGDEVLGRKGLREKRHYKICLPLSFVRTQLGPVRKLLGMQAEALSVISRNHIESLACRLP